MNVNKYVAERVINHYYVRREGSSSQEVIFTTDGVCLELAKYRAEKFCDMLNAGEMMSVPDRYYLEDDPATYHILDSKSQCRDCVTTVYRSVAGVGPFPAHKVAERICAMLNKMDRNGEL
jgi:hypothetical protein